MKNKAVILGANYYIGLSIIRSLGINNIKTVAVDYSEDGAYAFKSKYLSEKYIAPHYKKEPEKLLQFLIDYAKKQEAKPVLFPTADPYVEFIDEHINELREYYLLPDIEKGLYTRVMDKGTLSELANKHGVRVPETVLPTDEDFENKVETIIKFPCIVKPVDSPAFVAKFRRKLFKVFDMQQLKKSIKMAQDAGFEVIVQRIIPGFDDHMYTFDAYLNHDSKVTHWLTCQKYRQYPINFGASVYTEQKYVPELFEIGAPFLEAIGWKGFAEIEFKKDAENGKFYLIEINVRTTTLNVLLRKCGINMPLAAYRDLTGNELPTASVQKNMKYVFWYAYEDILAVRDYIRTGQLTLLKVLRSYFKRKAHSIWSIKDPSPFFSFFMYKLSKAVKSKLSGKKSK